MIPSREQCLRVLDEMPENVKQHCFAVEAIAVREAERLGADVKLCSRAALLHDCRRLSPEHADVAADLVAAKCWPELATAIRRHPLHCILTDPPHTMEERIVFYADKRVIGSKEVSLDERLSDIVERYGKDPQSKKTLLAAAQKARELEEQLRANSGSLQSRLPPQERTKENIHSQD